ncbi:RidA family protein [Microvirga makkahensis]|uniref:RidA family protein n=1 Tax=Microvirga makkahensis TaxID=1128670 RepID=A0A7X3SP82_9HYPH|nr:RidA family protein [Microvirga makkahensis]MXQ12186.1 RidA family protein [Microvirga makkahensis]
MGPEERLGELGLTLPAVRRSAGAYVPFRWAGSLLFLSGRGPARVDGSFVTGKVGLDVSVAEARLHARDAGLQLLAAAKAALGDLGRIGAVVKLTGMVNAVESFTEHPAVIDGCSQLLVDVLGGAGRHARTSFGVASLPHAMTVEVEAVVWADHPRG